MTARPEYVDVWIFRVRDAALELLLLRRSPGRLLGGMWQCVAGAIEPEEGIVAAALREAVEETGFSGSAIEAFYSLDFVASFLWEPADAVYSSVHFAMRVGPTAEPVLSTEHAEVAWLAPDDAIARAVWPAYREAITRVRENLVDPAREPWFRVEVPEGPEGPAAAVD
jgi:8-oxo-dGTP pyrophosphatase MutT (NUDIX family)